MTALSELAQALADLNEERFNQLIGEKIEAGENALSIVKECNAGMAKVGDLFQANEYFLSELILAGEMLRAALDRLGPLMGEGEEETGRGKVVIGTVKGDIHDIGKNVVVSLLKGAGFEVIDLGVDVPTERFVEEVKKSGAKILGLSCMLNLAFPEMKKAVDALKAAGLRDQVKVIVGGAPCNEEVRRYAGADYAATDAAVGLTVCRQVHG